MIGDINRPRSTPTKRPESVAQPAHKPQETVNKTVDKQKPKQHKRFVPFAWIMENRVRVAAVTLVAVVVIGVGGFALWQLNRDEDTTPMNKVAAEYQARLPELKEAVSEKPNNPEARKNYAVALYATGDTKEAQKQYEEAVKLNDKDAVAYNNLGNVYRDNEQVDKAIDSYKRSIELNKSGINAYVNLANVQMYTKDDTDAAIETYKQALQALPNNTQIELLLAIAYEHKNDTANAKNTYQKILSRDADNAAAKAALERLE